MRPRFGPLLLSAAGLVLAYSSLVHFGWMQPTTPVDALLSLGAISVDESLVHEGSSPTLVFLQHGLSRSAASMARLERALQSHGYQVVNVGYDSTTATIEQHAARLGEVVRQTMDATGCRSCAFVGHSMGGLVIRCYLASKGAEHPTAVVFLGTPHQGAALVDMRCHLWLFHLVMGDQAALQLSPSSGFTGSLPPPTYPAGCVIGGRGDGYGWNDAVPGDDDGTVAVEEARLEGAAEVVLPLGHTNLSIHDRALRQVLAFLKYRRFLP